METVDDILNNLALLQDGWGEDTYAKAINPNSLNLARGTLKIVLSSRDVVVPIPEIGPTQAGRIDLSWHILQENRDKNILFCTFGYNSLGYSYLQIYPEGLGAPICYVMNAPDYPEEKFEEITAREILDILADFFKVKNDREIEK
jgi:hypothetical protein